MKKSTMDELLAILADAKIARKQADNALAIMRHRLHEFEEKLLKIKPNDNV